MQSLYEVLVKLPLFAGIDLEEAQQIGSKLRSEHFEPQEVILRQEEWRGELYIIRSGLVSVAVRDAQGNSSELARLGRGECFGEMSLLAGQPPSATVTAIVDVDTWALSQPDFVTLLGRCPVLSQNINRILSERLSHTDSKYLTKRLAETTVLYDLEPDDKGSLLSLNIAVSLAWQTRRKVLLIELAEDSYSIPCTPELGILVDILEDRTLLHRHEAPIAPDNGLGGLRVVVLTSPQARDLQPADAVAALALIEPIYDHIIIHLPLGADSLSRSILERAQLIFLLLPYQGLFEARRHLSLLHSIPNAAQRASFVITGAPPQIEVNTTQELEAELGWKIEKILAEDATLMQPLGSSPFVLAKPSATLTREIDRLSRRMAKLSVGLALGSGFTKGFAHLGVLKVLEEEDVPIDYISGCSAGAIVGALYAMGYDSVELSKMALRIFTPTAIKSIFKFGFSALSLLSGKGMERLLREVIGEEQFNRLRIPFAAVAVDLNTGLEIILKEGPLYPAVRASASIPGIFPPLKFGELLLVDGGVLNPVPTRTAAALGANVVIGVDVSNPEPLSEWPDEYYAEAGRHKKSRVFRHAIDVLHRMHDIRQADIRQRSTEEAGVLISPRFGPCGWRDFHRARQCFNAGEQAAREALPQLGIILPRLIA